MAAPDTLTSRLALERLDRDLFRGVSPNDRRTRVFGGQVAAQALVAAVQTTQPRPAHSLHAYFLRPGDPKTPIIYAVDRIRDGKSFSTRRVVARQDGEAIFSLAVSFQNEEPGLSHQATMPKVPAPESVPSYDELLAKLPPEHPLSALRTFVLPIEIHDLDPIDPTSPRHRHGPHMVWWKTKEPLGDDLASHQCALTYASDFTLLDASLHRHGRTWLDPKMQVASIDHAIWFHRPFRADQWLLYVTDSPSTSGGRGLNFGRIYAADGTLVASVAQENLMREVGG
jgi:acyl-CoA thioesterase-2